MIFDAWEQTLLAKLPVQGKRVAQLPCNNGRELISLVNLGAQSGVGFDIADENIQQANHLKSCANAACEFYRMNLLDIPAEFNGQFDFVYISDYFAVVARLLRPAGWLLIHEAHPFTIGEFQEYEQDIVEGFGYLEKLHKVPLSFTLTACKQWNSHL